MKDRKYLIVSHTHGNITVTLKDNGAIETLVTPEQTKLLGLSYDWVVFDEYVIEED